MCCKLAVSFRPVLETIVTQNSRHPTAYLICQFTFFPLTHMPFLTPRLDLKIPEGRTYPSFYSLLYPILWQASHGVLYRYKWMGVWLRTEEPAALRALTAFCFSYINLVKGNGSSSTFPK